MLVRYKYFDKNACFLLFVLIYEYNQISLLKIALVDRLFRMFQHPKFWVNGTTKARAQLTAKMQPVAPELKDKEELVPMVQSISAQMRKRKGMSLVRPQEQLYKFVVCSKYPISSLKLNFLILSVVFTRTDLNVRNSLYFYSNLP